MSPGKNRATPRAPDRQFSAVVQASAPDATCCSLPLGDASLTAVHRAAPAHEFACAASDHLVVMAVPQYALTQALFDLGNGWRDHFCADPTPIHLLPPDTDYRWSVNGSSVVVMLALPMAVVKPLLDELGVPDALGRLSDVMDRGFSDPLAYDTVIRCWTDARLRRDLPPLLLQSRVVCMLHALASRQRPMPILAGQRSILGRRHLARVLDLMRDRMADSLTLEDLAAECGLSRFHFLRLFRGATGETPHQYLVKVRIERARLLLGSTNLPVAEVGAAVGYPDPGHFARVFSRLVGTTPARYRDTRH